MRLVVPSSALFVPEPELLYARPRGFIALIDRSPRPRNTSFSRAAKHFNAPRRLGVFPPRDKLRAPSFPRRVIWFPFDFNLQLAASLAHRIPLAAAVKLESAFYSTREKNEREKKGGASRITFFRGRTPINNRVSTAASHGDFSLDRNWGR